MSARPRSRVVALILSLVPGWGHIYWGRERLGLAIFTAFAVAGFVLLNGILVSLGPWKGFLVTIAAVLSVLVFVGAWIDLWQRTSPKRVQAEDGAREKFLREGTVSYLEGDLDRADSCFRMALEIDPQDVEAFFRLGVVCCRRGESRQAALWLRKVRRYDLDGKWDWEVKCERRRLKEARATGSFSRFWAAGPSSPPVGGEATLRPTSPSISR